MPETVLAPERSTRTARTGLSTTWQLVIVAAVAAALICAFLFTDIRGSFAYAINRRLTLVATMVIVAFAQGVATVVFHTITDNRILSPSIMGFDAMYVLMQTATVFWFGGSVLAKSEGLPKVLVQSALMVALATLLYRWLFSSQGGSMYVLLLVGVVLGMGFESLSSFMQRLLSPGDFDLLTQTTYASISNAQSDYLPAAALIFAGCAALLWRARHRLDVIALGREPAVSLGIDHRRELTRLLVIIAVLISVSTTLVGPMTFFGFLIATLTYELLGSSRHALMLPFVSLLGVCVLVGGQFILEHVFSAQGYLTIIIEFAGGLTFIALLLRKART